MTEYDHEQIRDLITRGMSAVEVCKKLGCSYGTVTYVVRKFGLSYACKTKPTSKRETYKAQILKLLGTGLTHQEIANQLGCSLSTVNNAACVRNGSIPDKLSQHEVRKYRYGVTESEYNSLFEQQGGKCAICKAVPDSPRARDRVLFLDHHHGSGKPRGLLCHCCNAGLGSLDDNPAVLSRSIRYLRQVLWSGPQAQPYARIEAPVITRAVNIDDPSSLKQAYESGMGINQLCKASGERRWKVYCRLKDSGVQLRRRGPLPPVPQPLDNNLRTCAACKITKLTSQFRTMGITTSYYCKECYYTHYWVPYKYGLPTEVYTAAIDALDGKCPILGTRFGRVRPVVDHCHKTGVVRGLISRKANMGIGLFDDDADLLRSAEEYLRAS